MKPLLSTDKHMFLDMQRTCDRLISELIAEPNDIKNIVTIERIANILISRMRKFLRTMTESEIFELTKELPSLKKMRIADKKLLAKTIIRFIV
jgi:hypothetical protein